ncbi:MAG: hypothetical protein JJU09_06460 [Rhodobacteraceae bacterium]|nr:hypothetical protein [Paracoccaceae bacterium]
MIQDSRDGPQALPIVTVAIGASMSVFPDGRLNAVLTPEDRFRLCFRAAEAPVDLERREADRALARDRPETGNVVAIRLGPCAYAAFAARAFAATRNGAWVAVGRKIAQTPAERWTDSDPDLMRAGRVIPEIAETLWLIAHADERYRPEARAMIDRLGTFFGEREGLLSGAMGR